MKESCSCGAKFEYVRGTTVTDERLERVWEMVKEWRSSHKHEFPPPAGEGEFPEPPTVIESGSSHERAEPYYPEDVRARPPIGFSRNP